MQLDVENVAAGKTAVVSLLTKSLDAGNVKDFKQSMQKVLEANSAVLIDMSGVDFVDSSGLGALLSCLRSMNNRNGQLKLCCMAKPVQALFELVRMHRIFAIYNTREEALAAL